MTWSIEEENVWLAGKIVGEVVSNDGILTTIKVLNAHWSAQSCTNCDDVNVIAFFVHRFDFLVTELGHAVVASVDEVLIELRFFLQLSRRNQAQIDDNIVAESRLVEDFVQLLQHLLWLIVLRLHFWDHLQESLVKVYELEIDEKNVVKNLIQLIQSSHLRWWIVENSMRVILILILRQFSWTWQTLRDFLWDVLELRTQTLWKSNSRPVEPED